MFNDSSSVQLSPSLNAQGAASANGVAAAPLFSYKLLYSREEAAEMLNIGIRTLDRLIAEKELPVRRIGRRVLITRDALEKFTRKDHQTVIQ
jgi:excisionase family DNA binding protein